MESPTVTVVETLAHPIDEVTFPAVTICPQNSNSDRWGTAIKILDYFDRHCPLKGLVYFGYLFKKLLQVCFVLDTYQFMHYLIISYPQCGFFLVPIEGLAT